jgi:periplasmic divalent cation tolerance protein
MADMPEYIQVTTTVASREEAERIAAALVASRLAACVQIIGPIRSTYHWKEKIETADEWQCTAKSRREAFDRLEAAIRRLHSYETPEIIATPIVALAADYAAWLEAETE